MAVPSVRTVAPWAGQRRAGRGLSPAVHRPLVVALGQDGMDLVLGRSEWWAKLLIVQQAN